MDTNPILEGLGDNPFTRLASLLQPITPRANITPIMMAVGEPQHQPPALLAETVTANAHLWNRYPPVNGTPEFRQTVQGWLTRRYGLPAGLLDAERCILPVSGTKEALFLSAQMAVPAERGGRKPAVLLPNPYYQVYIGGAAMAGAEPIFLSATAATGHLPDFNAVPEPVLARTALVYLCTPANPQGMVASLDYLKNVIRLARTYGFVLVVDECYSEIYDTLPPPGGLEACAALGDGLDNVLVFHSLSKRSSAAGLRAGFVAGDPKLIAKFQRLRAYGGAQVPMPLQAAAMALWNDEAHVEDNRRRYRLKNDAAEQALGTRFGFYRPPGGFFLWLDVGDGEAACRRLWQEAGIRTLPGSYTARGEGSANPGRQYIRVALVHEPEVVHEALTRMARVL